jgi:purine-nucleoside phosphorylase
VGTNPNVRAAPQLGTPLPRGLGGGAPDSGRFTGALISAAARARAAVEATECIFTEVEEAAAFIRQTFPEPPRVAVILGSGLGTFADGFDELKAVPYADIPHFPQSTVPGHAGRLAGGLVEGVRVLAMQGRFHLYEGCSVCDVVFPVRVLARLGTRVLVVTNAAGGIADGKLRPGDLMIIDDHLNLTGVNPLAGPNDARFGVRFPDMSEAYPERYRRVLHECDPDGTEIKSGIYAALLGPSYETPAEIRMLRALGADAVGMSTVHEVIAANHMGLGVAGISCISNMAAGVIPGARLCHEEVVATAARVRKSFEGVLRRAIPRLAAVDPS